MPDRFVLSSRAGGVFDIFSFKVEGKPGGNLSRRGGWEGL